MSTAEILQRVRALPRQEQLDIAERIWAELGDDGMPETPELLAELERRARDFKERPEQGATWEQVRNEARQRFGAK